MNVFHCDQPVFFENTECIQCGHLLAFLPNVADMRSLESTNGGRWRSPLMDSAGLDYRLCTNYVEHHVCNWAVMDGDPDSLCVSCRLTRVIPDLSTPPHRDEWFRLESAKRRLVYSLLKLELPFATKQDEPVSGLAFDFLADPVASDAAPILTGHADGVITINIAEADDAERERRRTQLHEWCLDTETALLGIAYVSEFALRRAIGLAEALRLAAQLSACTYPGKTGESTD